jgi:hypothetical protein
LGSTPQKIFLDKKDKNEEVRKQKDDGKKDKKKKD